MKIAIANFFNSHYYKEVSNMTTIIKIAVPALIVIGLFFIFVVDKETSQEEETASILISQMEIEKEDLENQIAVFKDQIKNLEQQIEKLESQEPEIKELIKEVPVIKEVTVTKEVIKEIPCNYDAPRIISIEIIPDINSATIKWTTDRLTNSKILVSGANFTEQAEFPSVFSLATSHRANITKLWPNTFYRYEIQASTMKNDVALYTTKKTGEFNTNQE